jgi:hypothetical protein
MSDSFNSIAPPSPQAKPNDYAEIGACGVLIDADIAASKPTPAKFMRVLKAPAPIEQSVDTFNPGETVQAEELNRFGAPNSNAAAPASVQASADPLETLAALSLAKRARAARAMEQKFANAAKAYPVALARDRKRVTARILTAYRAKPRAASRAKPRAKRARSVHISRGSRSRDDSDGPGSGDGTGKDGTGDGDGKGDDWKTSFRWGPPPGVFSWMRGIYATSSDGSTIYVTETETER